MAFVQTEETVFYSPEMRPGFKRNRFLLPGILVLTALVIIIGYLLYSYWRKIEEKAKEPLVECKSSSECQENQICTNLGTCVDFLEPQNL